MKICFGLLAGKNENPPVIWDSNNVVNPHMCLIGMTGSGKSHTLRKIIESLSLYNENPEHKIHVLDVHGDLSVPNASSVLFSEQTQYGLNPLKIIPDPDFGGIRKKTNSFIQVFKKFSRALGEKQIAVLRNLIYDTYENFGFKINDPRTWLVTGNDTVITNGTRFYIKVPIQEKDEARNLGASWDPQRKSWWVNIDQYIGSITQWPPNPLKRVNPNLIDVLRYAHHINQCAFLGTNSEACAKLEIAIKASNQFAKKRIRSFSSQQNGIDIDKENVERAKSKAIASYEDYVNSIVSGNEIEQLLKYDSSDVLMSVVDRLENLNAIGIFKSDIPPFDEKSKVWRYDIRALKGAERSMFILYKCQEIFEKAFLRGQTDKIFDTIVIDEAHMILDDEEDNIIKTIALEGRKFGIQLILASQSPEHFPKDVMTAIATKIVLGIDELLWKIAYNKMNISIDALKWIIVQKRFLIQMKLIGQSNFRWLFTYMNQN